MLVTTVATLGVAAVALFGPLQHSLRDTAKNTLRTDLTKRGATAGFGKLRLGFVLESAPSLAGDTRLGDALDQAEAQRKALLNAENQLGIELGATHVILFGYFQPNGVGYIIAPVYPTSDRRSRPVG